MTPSDPDFGPRTPAGSDKQAPQPELPQAEPQRNVPPPTPSRSAAARRPLPPSYGSWLVERIATHNPLYAVSAAFTLYGLQASFPASDVSGYAPKLAVSLAGYVVLLTAVAILLRRFGTLWQDLRMVGLLVVLLLPMISVALDETLLAAPAVGRISAIVGGVFAALIGEVLLHGLRVRLPFWYRLPYHLLMTLFFAYPLLFTTSIAGQSVDPHDAVLQWKLFGFAQAGAAILLIGLIAILRGPEYVSQNGTPWRWPLYPTTIFAFLTFCVVGRAYYLCRSFHPIGERESIFGPYFLVPLVLVIALLVLVAGVRNRNAIATQVGLALPSFALLLATVEPGRDVYYSEFLHRFQEATTALPPLVTLWLATAFFAGAAICRVRGAFHWLVVSLVAMAFVGPDSVSLEDVRLAQPWSLGCAAGLALARGLWRRDGFDCLVGASCTAAFVLLCGRRYADFPAMFAGYHALVLILLLTGWRLGAVRGAGLRIAAALSLLAGFALWWQPSWAPLFANALWALKFWYPLTLLLATAGFAWALGDRNFRDAAGWMVLITVGVHSQRGYVWLHRYVAGLDAIAIGLALLAAAVAVSLKKARRERLLSLERLQSSET